MFIWSNVENSTFGFLYCAGCDSGTRVTYTMLTPDILIGGVIFLCMYCLILFILSRFNSARLHNGGDWSEHPLCIDRKENPKKTLSEAGVYSTCTAIHVSNGSLC
jgi:hypothetical protein